MSKKFKTICLLGGAGVGVIIALFTALSTTDKNVSILIFGAIIGAGVVEIILDMVN